MSHFFHSKLLYNCKFHNIKDEQLDTITSLILLMLTMLPSMSYQLQTDSVLQSMSLLLQSSYHDSHAVLPMIDRLQLGWLSSPGA